MKIAQGLLKTWKDNKASNTNVNLEQYLRNQYFEYRKLSTSVGANPTTFAKWLQKPIESLN